MRQIRRYPHDKEYDFGIGVSDQFGLRKKAGDSVTEEEVEKYQIPEKFLEVKGKEKKNWEDELPEGADGIVFSIGIKIEGGDEFEKKRMVNEFEREFQDYIRQKGTVILTVIDIKVIKKRKKKE